MPINWKEIDENIAVRAAANAPGVEGSPESLPVQGVAAVATCSLPVSLVEDAAFRLADAALMAHSHQRHTLGDIYRDLALELYKRAQEASPTKRQPEENVAGQTRPERSEGRCL